MKVWLDDEVMEPEEATIPVTDHGLLYGDGVFEGIRVYGRQVFRIEDHLRRFEAGSKAIGLDLPGGKSRARKAVFEAARAYGRDEAYLRLLVTRGDGELGVDPTNCRSPRLICIADAIRLYSSEKLEHGVDLVTSSLRRPASDVLDPRVKSLNYLNSVLAKREARQRGADEALILNAAGQIAEASVANVFVVQGGELWTPPASDGALEGITRRSILELAARLGIPSREKTLGRFDLFSADEVFLSGTGARIVPVATLDEQSVAPLGASRPVTRRLEEAFEGLTRELGTSFD